MKHFVKVALLVFLLVGTLLAFAACGEKITGISIRNDHLPQVVYVEGQSLNLGDGVLTVIGDKGNNEIPLYDPSVIIEGYDAHTMGRQELTVRYGEATTTFAVTVVPRIKVENQEASYFLGDEFNKSKGRLRITRDDGSEFTVPMSDDAVTVEGFDSANPSQPLILDIRYTGADAEYIGTFEVNIFGAEEIAITKPTKVSYKSHDAGIKLDGGYITLKAANGTITRFVNLTEDMISGFDLSAATPENRETPLSQTVYIHYAGLQQSFNVSITYSDISLIRDSMTELTAINWAGETLPAVSQSQGETALELLDVYRKLTKGDKSVIGDDVRDTIIRTAAVYAYNMWESDVQNYEKLFKLEDGAFVLTGENYVDAKSDYDRFKSADAPLNKWTTVLSPLSQDYSSMILHGGKTLGDYLSLVYGPADIGLFAQKLDFIFDLYGKIALIPDTWTLDTLNDTYKSTVADALRLILSNDCMNTGDLSGIARVSGWRKNKDLMNLLYGYCAVANDATSANALKNLYVPTALTASYTMIEAAMKQVLAMYAGYSSRDAVTVYDTSMFFLYYGKAMQYANALVSTGDYTSVWMYYNLTFDFESTAAPLPSMLSSLRTTTAGYLYHHYRLMDNDAYMGLWNEYLNILNNYYTDAEYLKTNKFPEAVHEMFQHFVAMTPSEQYGFLCSLNPYYSMGLPTLAMEANEEGKYYTFFMTAVAAIYSSQFSEAANTVFCDLLRALEYNTRISVDTEAKGAFLATMKKAEEAYALLSDGDKTVIDTYVGYLYETCDALYQRYTVEGEQKPVDLGEWKDDFDALTDAIRNANFAYRYLSNGMNVYSAFFATVEKVEAMAENIRKNAPAEVVDAFNNQLYEIFTDTMWTYDYAVFYFHGLAMSGMTRMNVDSRGTLLYDSYAKAGLDDFLAKAADVIMAYMTSNGDNENYTAPTAESVKAALAAYRALSLDGFNLYAMLDNSYHFYARGMMQYFGVTLSENAAKAADKLLELENIYIVYTMSPDMMYSETVSIRDYLTQVYNEYIELYNALEGEEKTAYDTLLSDTAAYYTEAYGKIGK